MSDPGTTPGDAFSDGVSDSDDEGRADDVDREYVGGPETDDAEEALETVTNDAVAGETVEPQLGDGTDDGPTGGAPNEGAPDLWEHDAERPDLGGDLGTKPL
jgi:hypothetical protein